MSARKPKCQTLYKITWNHQRKRPRDLPLDAAHICYSACVCVCVCLSDKILHIPIQRSRKGANRVASKCQDVHKYKHFYSFWSDIKPRGKLLPRINQSLRKSPFLWLCMITSSRMFRQETLACFKVFSDKTATDVILCWKMLAGLEMMKSQPDYLNPVNHS